MGFNIPSGKEWTLAVISLGLLAYNVIRYLGRKLEASSGLFPIILGACFNPYTFSLITKDTLDTIQQVAWAAFILMNALRPQSYLHYAWLGVSTALNPSNFLYFFISIDIKQNRTAKSSIYMLATAVAFAYLHYMHNFSINHYVSFYFPQSFEPQFNLIWMLYAHMFDRYLHLYQIVFVVLQVSAAPLIASLRLPHNFKITLLTYFKVYCCYKCSQLCLVVALGLSFIFLKEQLDVVIANWWKMGKDLQVMKVKTLTLIAVITNIAFFPLDKILLSRYLNDFSVNIGYLFLFFGFPWILNSVYLAQISLNINSHHQKGPEEATIMHQKAEQEPKT